MRTVKGCKDKSGTVAEYMENIVIVAAVGILVILTHAEKEKDEEIVGIVDAIEGRGKVMNCPAAIVTKLLDGSQAGVVPLVGFDSLSPKYAEAAEPTEVASDPATRG